MENIEQAVQGSEKDLSRDPIVRVARAFNLVSGGPSRAHLREEDLIPDSPVVTVNRAIDIMDQGIHVDFAMFADGPEVLVNELGLGKYIVPPLQIWVPRAAVFPANGVLNHFDMASRWETFLPMSVGVRVTPFGLVGGVDGQMRHQFAVLAALQRMLMFRPSEIRILCADMMGSWVPGKTEEECEEIQSKVAQLRRELGIAQKQVTSTKGGDQSAIIVRDNVQAELNRLQAAGDIGLFKRWEHERNALKEFVKRAGEQGCKVEFRTPAVVTV